MGVRYFTENGLTMSNGNTKIGNDTLILNITSATDCPSRAMGLCQIPEKCYAIRPEKFRPGCLPYRRRQAYFFDSHTPQKIASAIISILKIGKNSDRIRYIRFSESGDFKNQDDIDKLDKVAQLVGKVHCPRGKNSLIWYGYSARSDLDFSRVKKLLVKGSNHDQGNNGIVIVRSLTKAEKSKKSIVIDGKRHLVCPGQCYGCKICKTKGKAPLVIAQH